MAYNTDIKIKLAQQADKVVNALVIQTNGTTRATYNGSAAATVNITAATVGAAASSHTHAGTAITGLTANRALISNGSGQVAVSAVTSTELGYLDGVTSNIQTQLNGKAASSHTHGLVHSDLTTTLPDTTTDNGWSMINSTYNGFILKSIRSQTSAPAWYASAYSSGIAFGGADTKAVISVNYSTPLIKFAGGNGTKPTWNMGISGTSGRTYNLNNYLPLSGGTLTGRLTSNGKISVPTTAGQWISGMTSTNAFMQVTTQQRKRNYYTMIYVKTNSNHVFNLGGIQNRVGFYGYYNGRTANGTDWSTEWNVDSGTLSHSGALFINNKVRIWGDNEGGNIRVYSPSGSTYYEMDAVQNVFRLYYSNPYKVIFQTDTSGNLNVPTSISTASLTVTSIRCNSNIEMYGPTPFIDFHYNNSTADYTARIIADTANRLHIQASGGLQVSNGLNVSGTIKATSEMFQTISGETWHWGPGCGTGVATRFGIRRQSNGYTFYFDGATGGMYLGGVIQAGGLSTTGNINARTLNLSGSAVAQTDLIVNGTVYFNGSKSRFMSNGIWIGGYTISGTPSGPNIRFFGPVHDFYGWSNLTSASRPCCYITDGSSQAYDNGNVRFARYVSSSRRFKNTITQEFDDTCNPEKLYELPVVTYHYNKNYDSSDKEGKKLHIGFIAEDVDELFPIACGYEDDGKTPENWNHMELIPGMMKLIQDQHKEILDLQDRVKTLEAQMIEVLNLLSK